MPDPVVHVDPAQAVQAVDGAVTAAGGLGAITLGWFGWIVKRAFGVTIPRLSHDFKQALADQQAAFKEALAEQRADFREEMRLARADLKDALKEERAEHAAKLTTLATAVERLDTTLRQRGA